MLELKVFLVYTPFLLNLSISFLLFPLVISQIPLGSKFSPLENKFWVSLNGDFALGFISRTDQPNLYNVGIRFNSYAIPVGKQTVVWVAGADVTVSNKSYFQLSQAGNLLLFDSLKGVTVWSSKTSHLSVSSAVLHDNGNFVLLDVNKLPVWQSFDTPSNSLLPGQNFSVLQTLRAASRNSISSYYSLCMDVSSQLQLKWESNVIYWESKLTSRLARQAVLTPDGALQLLDTGFRPIWSMFGSDHNDSSIKFRFLRLDVDGNLRLYSWIESRKSWKSVWQAVDDQCKVFATCDHCGICVFSSSGSPTCKCPFKSSTASNSTCLAPYKPECDYGSTMVTYEHTFLYGLYPPNDSITQTSLQQCKSSCLKDPLCTAVTFTNDGTAECRMKKTQYFTGYSDPSLVSVSFVRICLDPVAVLPMDKRVTPLSSPPFYIKRSREFCFRCLFVAFSVTFIVLFVIQLGIGFCFYKRRRYFVSQKASLAYSGLNSNGLIVFSHSEIKDLTGNFEQQIGPKVFKGVLSNNQLVAIKQLQENIEERKFRCAVSVIGSIHHKNLLKLVGYCCESNYRLLVYEFAENGSVNKRIEDSNLAKKLRWSTRIEICLSVARAICYLHSECREFVSHGNLKWENVVLDEELQAKVSEIAACNGGVAERDVEDFGKMVVILLSGKKEDENLIEWAYNEWFNGKAERVADRRLEKGVNLEELERVLKIAFWCLQVDKWMKPSMEEVVKVLEGTLSVDPPPPPFVSRAPLTGKDVVESD